MGRQVHRKHGDEQWRPTPHPFPTHACARSGIVHRAPEFLSAAGWPERVPAAGRASTRLRFPRVPPSNNGGLAVKAIAPRPRERRRHSRG